MAAESQPYERLALPLDLSFARLFASAGLTVTSSRPRLRMLELVDTAGCRLAATGADLRAGPADVWSWRRDPLGHPKLAEVEWATAGAGAAARAAAWSRGYARGRRLERRIPVRSYQRDHAVSSAAGENLLTIAEERLDEPGEGAWTPRQRSVTVRVVKAGRHGAAALSLLVDAAQSGSGPPIALLRPRLVRRPVLRLPDVGEGVAVEDLLQRSLVLSTLQWLHFDAEVRGDSGSVDGIRKIRVGLRRIRSDLVTFRPLLERPWADGIRADLAGIAAEIGRVRDIEVRRERLVALAAQLPPADQRAAATLATIAGADHDGALAQLRELLDSAPYLATLETTIEAVTAPRWLDDAAPVSVAALVHRPWRRLHRFVRDMATAPTDDELHRVRILAKRARYAADAAVPAHPPAAVNVVALAALQTILGEHHDAAVNREWLRAVTGEHPELAFAAGALAALEGQTMAAAAAAWGGVWRTASRRRDWRWLRD